MDKRSAWHWEVTDSIPTRGAFSRSSLKTPSTGIFVFSVLHWIWCPPSNREVTGWIATAGALFKSLLDTPMLQLGLNGRVPHPALPKPQPTIPFQGSALPFYL
ncbi:hypothetical protein DPMN_036912 [Dreissena polymorpha]|uniref:Uncharacterized protein n=1 Tax=Dreissena polymorpha TaxID=45954 RepID=A0A9D4RPB1_DREPO|nr:hypothetical protein DPMN_036912 [Dreissena polymorpha]